VFLLLLCNDEAVLGPWINGRSLNVFTGGVIAVLVVLSITLTASVLFPDMGEKTLLALLGGGTVFTVAISAVLLILRREDLWVWVDDFGRMTWRMPPLGQLRLINKQPLSAGELETQYTVELRCQGQQEAHIRALLLQATTSAGLGLRRLTSENLEDSPQVTVSALLVSPNRHDAALEQIIGRMSLEPFVTAAHWQATQARAES
jgi:hypothetical protein